MARATRELHTGDPSSSAFRYSPNASPTSSPVSSPRPPKLITRLDSIGGPAERDRINPFGDSKDGVSPSSSDSSTGFDSPSAKLRDITRKKLNTEKKNLKKRNIKKEKNLLSTKDYHSKLQDLKVWIAEMGYTDIGNMSDKKLKEHFKKFVEKWNKRKLPPKYYRGVDLYSSPLNSKFDFHTGLNISQSLSTDNTAESISCLDDQTDAATVNTAVVSDVDMLTHQSSNSSSFSPRFATINRVPISTTTPTKLAQGEYPSSPQSVPKKPIFTESPKPKIPPKPPTRIITCVRKSQQKSGTARPLPDQSVINTSDIVDDLANKTDSIRAKPPNMGRQMLRRSLEMSLTNGGLMESTRSQSGGVLDSTNETNETSAIRESAEVSDCTHTTNINPLESSQIGENSPNVNTLSEKTGLSSTDNKNKTNPDRHAVNEAQSLKVCVVPMNVSSGDDASIQSGEIQEVRPVPTAPKPRNRHSVEISTPDPSDLYAEVRNEKIDSKTAVTISHSCHDDQDESKVERRKSGEKRPMSDSQYPKQPDDVFYLTRQHGRPGGNPPAKRKAVWSCEVEKEKEIFL